MTLLSYGIESIEEKLCYYCISPRNIQCMENRFLLINIFNTYAFQGGGGGVNTQPPPPQRKPYAVRHSLKVIHQLMVHYQFVSHQNPYLPRPQATPRISMLVSEKREGLVCSCGVLYYLASWTHTLFCIYYVEVYALLTKFSTSHT